MSPHTGSIEEPKLEFGIEEKLAKNLDLFWLLLVISYSGPADIGNVCSVCCVSNLFRTMSTMPLILLTILMFWWTFSATKCHASLLDFLNSPSVCNAYWPVHWKIVQWKRIAWNWISLWQNHPDSSPHWRISNEEASSLESFTLWSVLACARFSHYCSRFTVVIKRFLFYRLLAIAWRYLVLKQCEQHWKPNHLRPSERQFDSEL